RAQYAGEAHKHLARKGFLDWRIGGSDEEREAPILIGIPRPHDRHRHGPAPRIRKVRRERDHRVLATNLVHAGPQVYTCWRTPRRASFTSGRRPIRPSTRIAFWSAATYSSGIRKTISRIASSENASIAA